MELKKATEKELRETDVIWPESLDELNSYIKDLSERKHDYGTCVYAMSMAAVATYYYMSHVLRVSGFQASCADMDFLKRTRRLKNGFTILDYDHLLYPQYFDEDHFPTPRKLLLKNIDHFTKEAEKLLKKGGKVHPDVRKHWEWIISLKNIK